MAKKDFRARGQSMEPSVLAESEDESLQALGLILEAWEAGADRGVAPELMAYAAIYTALTDLVSNFGEECVADLARGLVDRISSGEFTITPRPQTAQ